MSSVVRSVRKRKKSRVLGEVQVVQREAYEAMELDTRVELIRALVPLGLMHVQELLEEEVDALAGARYARQDGCAGTRHGNNPGTVRLAGQRVPIQVPRVRSPRGELGLRSYAALHGSRGAVDEGLLRRVLYGISCRNYAAAAAAIPGAIGLSSSTVSRAFVEASAAQLKAFQERDLGGEDLVALFLDGKTFAASTLVIAMGVRATGEKRFLGFVETDTENEAVLTPFLRSLLERGLDIARGLLVILDGGKGLRAAVRKAFTGRALVQRCQWHKRENVVRYVPKREQASWRRRLQRAYERPTYAEARTALQALAAELDQKNQSAAASLAEGLEETLTLHRLGVYGVLGRSLKTTNCLESVNAGVEERCAKVDCWKTSAQKHRWLATALLDIEPRLRKVKGYAHLPMLRVALQRTLKIDTKSVESVEEAA
jgi:transposase-like protein